MGERKFEMPMPDEDMKDSRIRAKDGASEENWDEKTGVVNVDPELVKATMKKAELEKNHPSLADAPEEVTGVVNVDQMLVEASKKGAAIPEKGSETLPPPAMKEEKVSMVAKDVGSLYTEAVVNGQEMSAGKLIEKVTETLKTPEFANEKFSTVSLLLDLKNELNDTAKWLRAAGKESEAAKHEEMAAQMAKAADAAGDKRPLNLDIELE